MTAHQGHSRDLQARDVVAFGQEFGRVLSDGRIVGRPEPFAKVFPSSREVKRAVGVTAWAILEDIALDARVDVEGRLVADTNVRRIADNLGLATNTVAKHLGRLRDHGFVLHEEQRADDSGQYATSRYVLDPSACLERFTHTPTTRPPAGRRSPSLSTALWKTLVVRIGLNRTQTTVSARVPILATRLRRPCRNSCDTVICDTTTKTLLFLEEQQQQTRPIDARPVSRARRLGPVARARRGVDVAGDLGRPGGPPGGHPRPTPGPRGRWLRPQADEVRNPAGLGRGRAHPRLGRLGRSTRRAGAHSQP